MIQGERGAVRGAKRENEVRGIRGRSMIDRLARLAGNTPDTFHGGPVVMGELAHNYHTDGSNSLAA